MRNRLGQDVAVVCCLESGEVGAGARVSADVLLDRSFLANDGTGDAGLAIPRQLGGTLSIEGASVDALMHGGRRGPPPKLPRAAVAGIALILIAPVLWVSLPATGLWESRGPPTASAAGTQSQAWDQFGSAQSVSTVYDPSTQTVVVAFFGAAGIPGGILFLGGQNLSVHYWLYPGCNPASAADDPATGQVVVLCQLTSLDWELLTVSASSHAALATVPVPGGNAYYDLEQIALDSATDVAYVVQEPSNVSNPQHILGVQATTGVVVSNLTVSTAQYQSGAQVAVGPSSGTLLWMDRQSGEVELLNSTTGAVLDSSAPVGAPYQAMYYNPAAAALFLPNVTSMQTTLVSARDLSVIETLPADSRGGVETDPLHADTYLYGLGAVNVVRTSDWSPVGSVSLSAFLDSVVYDPVADQFVGAASGEGAAVELISISRAPVIGPSFSSVPVLGSNLPASAAGASLVAGVALVVATWRKLAVAMKERQAARDREFAKWMAEPSIDKWHGDRPGEQRKG